MPKHTIAELNQFYSESEEVDKGLFAEQRSNILLVHGDHWTKKNSKYWTRIRDAKALTDEQKIRITKNHTQKISKTYVNNILSHAPGVTPVPKNEKELSDIKAAELNKAVWLDICDRHGMDAQIEEDAQDFINVGEVAMKVFWDPNAGKFKGWEAAPMMDEVGGPVLGEDGNPMYEKDEAGEYVPSKKPVFSGDFVFERIYGFNLLRAKEAKNMKDNELFIIRKMADLEELKKKYEGDEEKSKFLHASKDETFVVFDGAKGYKNSDKEVLLKEFFFRPSFSYPNGYFYIATDTGILEEGELPGGFFCLLYEGFDKVQTSPRGYSIIKQTRAYQIEINRSASKLVEHQLSLGDDKLLIQSGTKLTSGSTLPGIRGVQYTGMKPEVLPGRAGDQYLGYMNSQIEELYRVANVAEDSEEKIKNADPFAMLFMSMRDKKKFSIYAQKFERYQKAKCRLVLQLAKLYYPEEMLVPAIGKHEIINIQEFKNTNDLSVEIKLKEMSEDVETMFGKQLVMNHAIQYVGNQLSKEDIGRIIRNMPFGNADESFRDLTMDYDAATNVILALDRGEEPEINPSDTGPYMLKRLVNRTRQSDFRFLDQRIQYNYRAMIQLYEQMEAEKQMKVMEAQAGFIPSGGAQVAVDFYVADAQNPNKVSRAKLPAEAVNWLIKRLAEQGTSQQDLRNQATGTVADIAGMVSSRAGQGVPQTQEIPRPAVSQAANLM